MFKKVIGFGVAASMLMVGGASAASVTNVEYNNGDVTVQGNAGQSVSGKVRVVVANNEEVEFVQFDVISDNLSPVCVNVNRLQEGTHFVNIPGDVKFPPNTGTYSLSVTSHGIFGGLAADDCVGDQNGSQSFSNSVRTVGSSAPVVGAPSVLEQLQATIASLMAQISCMSAGNVWSGGQCGPKPAPAKPAYCAQAANHTVWQGQSGGAVSAYQMFLISNGFSIPAGATGYYGVQTQGAAMALAMACK